MSMKSRAVQTITSNEEYVRMRIFDGDLPVSEAAAELLRIERAHHDATRFQLSEAIAALADRPVRLRPVRLRCECGK